MPGKARRVASRQAQLGRRRKRQQTRPEDGQTGVSVTGTEADSVQQESDEVTAVAESTVLNPPEAPTPPVRQTSRPPRPARPSPVADRTLDAELAPARRGGRGRRERLTVQSNIGAEIKRILAMSATVLTVIIVLGIVL
ncbi:MAG: hypothetical protein BZY75_05850 [SAR202 cluster bacterium Io17-Chloro-G7]|nr:MAG: hypothetical protein BZY75_05850 [SAR202 cluster bacterium Io17-Chloro-G7]